MPDGDSLELVIEELHVHIHSNGAVDAVTDGIDVGDDTDVSEPDEQGERPTPTRPDGLRYDVRDRPIKGLILEEIDESAGITEQAITSITDANKGSVNAYLGAFEGHHLVTEDDGYYQLTELGESVLETYRQRWIDGKRNLPEGYWKEITA